MLLTMQEICINVKSILGKNNLDVEQYLIMLIKMKYLIIIQHKKYMMIIVLIAKCFQYAKEVAMQIDYYTGANLHVHHQRALWKNSF